MIFGILVLVWINRAQLRRRWTAKKIKGKKTTTKVWWLRCLLQKEREKGGK
jgi:hypothetical protein